MDIEDMINPPDWYLEQMHWKECDTCANSIPPHQDFCYKCLSIEAKWKLGVL